MKLHDVINVKPQKVLGVDASTKSYAWCLLDGDTLVDSGEEVFSGATMYEKMQSAQEASERLAALGQEFTAIEQAVFVNNRAVTIKLSYFYGILMGAMAKANIPFDDVAPMTWMTEIGNGRFTKQERLDFKKQNPGNTKTWYKNKMRELRKQRTMDWVKQEYGIEVTNDNIGDAIGVATYIRRFLNGEIS